VMMNPLIDRGEYAALAHCTYLNQASLGLIPRTSVEASVRFLTDVAQHGNLRLSDQAEARVLDELRTAAAELLGAPVSSVAVVGGASEGLGQLAALVAGIRRAGDAAERLSCGVDDIPFALDVAGLRHKGGHIVTS